MRKILFIISLILLVPAASFSGTVTISSPVPSPSGNYDRLRLVPRNPIAGACENGTFYVPNDTNVIYFCKNNVYAPLTSPWMQTGTNVHLIDPVNNKVGIGTSAPEFKLTLNNDGGILADGTWGSGASISPSSGIKARMIWYPRKAAFRAGKISGAQWNDANIGDFSIAAGYNTTASGLYSTAFGEVNNATNQGATVAGGQTNQANGLYSFVGSGQGNAVASDYGVIAGGSLNQINGVAATVVGGLGNHADGWRSFIGGGGFNLVAADTQQAVIGGGQANRAELIANLSFIGGGSVNVTKTGTHGVIGGGDQNTVEATMGTVTGGQFNHIQPNANLSFVGGGINNIIWGQRSVIGGGDSNIVGDSASPGGISRATISGGFNNFALADGATVGGGTQNHADAIASTVAGGNLNIASGDSAAVGGGASNHATAQASTVSGGDQNQANGLNSTVAGGIQNFANGAAATIPGGANNVVDGDHSVAMGQNMVLGAAADRTFIWGHSGAAITPVTAPNAFIIYSGNVGIRTVNPQYPLHITGLMKLEPVDAPPIACTDDGLVYAAKNALCYCDGSGTWEKIIGKGKCG